MYLSISRILEASLEAILTINKRHLESPKTNEACIFVSGKGLSMQK